MSHYTLKNELNTRSSITLLSTTYTWWSAHAVYVICVLFVVAVACVRSVRLFCHSRATDAVDYITIRNNRPPKAPSTVRWRDWRDNNLCCRNHGCGCLLHGRTYNTHIRLICIMRIIRFLFYFCIHTTCLCAVAQTKHNPTTSYDIIACPMKRDGNDDDIEFISRMMQSRDWPILTSGLHLVFVRMLFVFLRAMIRHRLSAIWDAQACVVCTVLFSKIFTYIMF